MDATEGTPVTQAELREIAFERIRHYSTTLFGVRPNEGVNQVGSGTFVRVGEWRCVLTAEHVWAVLAEDSPKLALTAGGGNQPSIALDRDLFREIYRSTRLVDAWGPDLALIEVPPSHANALDARGVSFYDLGRRRDHTLVREGVTANEPRAVVGTPAEFTKTRAVDEGSSLVAKAYLENTLIASRLLSTHWRDGYDYVDLSLHDKRDGDFPTKYGGMSGSGLWWLGRDLENGKFTCTLQDIFLDGVVYFHSDEGAPVDEMIRCHGRKSIYRVLLDAVLPPKGVAVRDGGHCHGSRS